jgi:hypothetical protein
VTEAPGGPDFEAMARRDEEQRLLEEERSAWGWPAASTWRDHVDSRIDIDALIELFDRLHQISAGELHSRDRVVEVVRFLMLDLRDERDGGLDEVVDRLLRIPADRFTGNAVIWVALEIITAYPEWPRIAVGAWGRRMEAVIAQDHALPVLASLGPHGEISIVDDGGVYA